MSILDHKVSDTQELLHKKEVTVTDLVDDSFKRIHEVEDKVKAFITLDEERCSRKIAKELDQQDASKSILFGMPIGVKDNIVTKGLTYNMWQ